MEKLKFVPRDYVMDSIRSAVLVEHDRPSCQVCGFHKSDWCKMVYSYEYEDSINLYVCDNCEGEIRSAKGKSGNKLFEVTDF